VEKQTELELDLASFWESTFIPPMATNLTRLRGWFRCMAGQ